MFKKILDYFQKQSWKYLVPEKSKKIAILGISTENAKYQCFLDVNEDDEKIIFLSIYPINVPKELRTQLAELLIRINYFLFLGSFEMDFLDGEIRFKTSLIYGDSEVTDSVIGHIVNGNIATMDDNFNLINSFLSGKIVMEEAIQLLSQTQISG